MFHLYSKLAHFYFYSILVILFYIIYVIITKIEQKRVNMDVDISRLKDITVLYCEDEEYLRDITKGILESFTKKQFICEDGDKGLLQPYR